MRFRPVLLPCALLLLGFLLLLVPHLGAQQAASAALPPITATMKSDPLTRSAFDHYYNLEYDQAVKEFERDLEQHPQDPFAVNHLINALMFRELYRTGALDTSLYANNSFINKKTYPVDPAVKQRLQELTQRALQLEEARLKVDPNDVDSLYARGTTLPTSAWSRRRGTRRCAAPSLPAARTSASWSSIPTIPTPRRWWERTTTSSPGCPG
jgi:tetratricopeptide (TPR) repeat protein